MIAEAMLQSPKGTAHSHAEFEKGVAIDGHRGQTDIRAGRHG